MKKTTLIVLFSMACTLLSAQNADTMRNSEPQIDLKPKFRGTLRTRYEYDFNENLNRFAVRNARAAVSGNANRWISYLVQVDLSDNGVFRVLDAEIQMKPTENLTLIVGQTFVPFIQKHLLTPGQVMFANRAMINRYMSGAPRDIGVYANYRFGSENLPIHLTGAVFNGAGTNNPRWVEPKDLGYAFRLMFGSMDNFQLAFKTYNATDVDGVKNEIYGVDLRYANREWSDGFTLEAEIVGGNYKKFSWLEVFTDKKFGYYLQTGNVFKTGKQSINYIEPIARWDMMRVKGIYISDANRLTLGTNFGFNPTYRKTELRLNYEKYFVNKNLAGLLFGANNTSWHDRIALELLLNFN
ncbi:MAG: hypothetical protein LBP96_01530 [Bacteroidales bacterium]|jgi:hypothetical protein|nr:hypothetical protein [Bacteroidales bacterium]